MKEELARRGREDTQVLDELQRGTETPPTVETMEGAPTSAHGERREIPVPHPGERPGAVRADHAPVAPRPQPSGGLATDEEEPPRED